MADEFFYLIFPFPHQPEMRFRRSLFFMFFSAPARARRYILFLLFGSGAVDYPHLSAPLEPKFDFRLSRFYILIIAFSAGNRFSVTETVFFFSSHIFAFCGESHYFYFLSFYLFFNCDSPPWRQEIAEEKYIFQD